MDDRQEIRLRDLDGLGEIRVTVWTDGADHTFRFALYADPEDDDPRDTIDVSAEDAKHLASGILGTVMKKS
jgi:ssDNA-binding replication factor A large subunit